MGREVRMVPPNWDHPKNDKGHLQPMFDREFQDEADNWKRLLLLHIPAEHDGWEFWEWHGKPPDREYHRPWKSEDATWFQVWETVSEGTPVTPPFATKAELVDYLATNGDAWDQSRGHGAWSRDAAEKFVGTGWAPSLIITNNGGAVSIQSPRDGGL